jgi:putative DNA primase/helicase
MSDVPGGRFDVRSDGVYYKDPNPKVSDLWLCSKLEVIALSRDSQSERWARLVRFSDPDGVEHEIPLWNAMLADNGNPYRRWLSSHGLRISPDRQAREHLTQ